MLQRNPVAFFQVSILMLFGGYLWQKCLVFLSWNEYLKKTFIIKVNKSLFQRNRVKLSPLQLYIKLCPIGCCGGGCPSTVRRVFLMRDRKSKNEKTKSTKKMWQEKWKWSESGGQNMKFRDVFSGLSLNSAFEFKYESLRKSFCLYYEITEIS